MKRLLFIACSLVFALGCSVKKSGSSSSGGGGGDKEEEAATDADDGDPNADGTDPDNPVVDVSGKLQFVNPSEDAVYQLDNGAYAFQVAFNGALPTAQWGLFYSETKNSFSGGIPIIEDLGISTGEVTWDTTFVDPGTYYVYAILEDGGITTVYYAKGSFVVGGESEDNAPPAVSLTLPDKKIYNPGEAMPITFNAVDKEGAAVSTKVEYTADGSTWNVIQEGLTADDNQITWDIPNDAVETARYFIRVTSSDGTKSTEVVSEDAFGVLSAGVTVTFNDQIRTIFAASCDSCHTGPLPSAPAGQNGFDTSLYNDNGGAMRNGANGIRKTVLLGRTRIGAPNPMPADGSLSAADSDMIQFWFWQNNPQN